MLIYNLILNILFVPLIIVYLLIAVFNKRLRKTFLLRLGFKTKHAIRNPVWFHCSSLGEVTAIENVIVHLKKFYKKIFISTLTETGLSKAQKIVNKDYASILPFDFSFLIKKFIKNIKPRILIIEETEIWPNLIWQTAKKGIPVIYINALISEKSFRFYKIFKFIFARILDKINIFFVQNQQTAEYLRALGIPSSKMKYIGITKFDISLRKNIKPLRLFKQKSPVITCGSTREGEEEIILSVFLKLKNEFKNLKLILVPRHLERIEKIKKILTKHNLKFDLYTSLKCKAVSDIILVDKMGILMNMYKAGTITFVGGTLVPVGGHNPLEPAYCKKPVIFGPYIKNNYVAFQLLLKNNAAFMVKNETELYKRLKELLKKPAKASKMGENGFKTLKKNQGTSKRLAEFIWKNYLKK